MTLLSETERAEFFRLIGRPIDDQYIPIFTARSHIKINKLEIARGKRYTCRVWKKRNLFEYLIAQASCCAQFAMEVVLKNGMDRTYYLHDAGGKPSKWMGKVHFRTQDFGPSSFGFDMNEVNEKSIITIESIELHPSLRNKGFLTKLMQELKMRGFKGVALGNIANPSLAYHFYQKSLVSNKVVLLSLPRTIEFDVRVSPMPTFAVLLT